MNQFARNGVKRNFHAHLLIPGIDQLEDVHHAQETVPQSVIRTLQRHFSRAKELARISTVVTVRAVPRDIRSRYLEGNFAVARRLAGGLFTCADEGQHRLSLQHEAVSQTASRNCKHICRSLLVRSRDVRYHRLPVQNKIGQRYRRSRLTCIRPHE